MTSNHHGFIHFQQDKKKVGIDALSNLIRRTARFDKIMLMSFINLNGIKAGLAFLVIGLGIVRQAYFKPHRYLSKYQYNSHHENNVLKASSFRMYS